MPSEISLIEFRTYNENRCTNNVMTGNYKNPYYPYDLAEYIETDLYEHQLTVTEENKNDYMLLQEKNPYNFRKDLSHSMHRYELFKRVDDKNHSLNRKISASFFNMFAVRLNQKNSTKHLYKRNRER
jgi:hypothetical protein